MEKVYIESLKNSEGKTATIEGWVANRRDSKGLIFLNVRDGFGLCQCIVDEKNVPAEIFEIAGKLGQESSVCISGKVVKDERQIGGFEIHVSELKVYQNATEYPVTNKEHGVDFLMDNRHLWLRSQRQWAIMRIRNTIIFSIHKFFQENNFIQMDAPLFTGNACEGTSNLFETDFFGDTAYLSQSGQLYGEAMAMAMNKIYTFGPTFRAEKSKTRRHLAEFWMIEPEMAFYDIFDNMDCIEGMLKYVVNEVLSSCKNELAVIGRDTTVLENIAKPFPRMTYDQAVRIIKGEENVDEKNSITELENDLKNVHEKIETIAKDIAEREGKIAGGTLKKGEINFNQNKIDKLRQEIKEYEEEARNIPQWLESARNFCYGNDFGGSDETVLTRLFTVPVMVYNWPHEVKAFYLKRDPENEKFARGVDVLAPEGYGEIVGGGERETDVEKLKEKIIEHELPMKDFEWYLDLRRYGSVKHAGFGLGLERLVCWVCKLPHVREAIPFPRMVGRILP